MGRNRSAKHSFSGRSEQMPYSEADKLPHLPLRLLRITAVRDRTGLSRSTIWRLERQGAFPKRHKISANIVAWTENEVVEWIRRQTQRLTA